MKAVEPIRDINKLKKIEKMLARKNKRDQLMFVFGTNSGLSSKVC